MHNMSHVQDSPIAVHVHILEYDSMPVIFALSYSGAAVV